jgi:hypothetical protein
MFLTPPIRSEHCRDVAAARAHKGNVTDLLESSFALSFVTI